MNPTPDRYGDPSGSTGTRPATAAEKSPSETLSPTRSLALIGFPCSGKTTVGQLLATSLNLPWLDADADITRASGQSPADWLRVVGEPAFREIERTWLQTWTPRQPCVLSTGGGLPCYQDNLELLRRKAAIIYLELDFTTLLHRLQVPPGHALTRLYEATGLEVLYHRRAAIYARADLVVSAEGSPEAVLSRILTKL